MPVRKCSNGKYRIGDGKCMYNSKASAERAYRGYLGSKHANESTIYEDREIKDHLEIDGIPINLEFLKGETEHGKNSKTGEEWSRKFYVHYGYIVGTEGADGDSVDVFVKPKLNTGKDVFVIHGLTPDGSAYDEDKIMVGFDNAEQARKIWSLHVHEPENMFGGVCRFSNEEFQKILTQLQRGHRGIIAKPEVFRSLKERGLLGETNKVLAFKNDMSGTEEYDTSTAEPSHFVPSDRYPDHEMGRFGQYTGTPLDNEGEKWGYGDQGNPNLFFDNDYFEPEKEDPGPELAHIGHYGQYQSEPMDHGNDYIPSGSTPSATDNVIPIDFHKEYVRKTGKVFDEDPKDTEYDVNDASEYIDAQEEDIRNWVKEELNKRRIDGGLMDIMKHTIDVINRNQDYLYLKFGKSFTEKEKRKFVADVSREYKV